jgi:uncharacterized protein YbjT (DUF2867 family)
LPKIVVVGGSGLVGAKLVTTLRERDETVVSASPSSGVNTVTSAGLAAALQDAHVVIDVTNSPSFEDAAALEFFQTSGRNLLAAEAAAGVEHHIALSIVGVDRNPDSGYFAAKLAQELLVKGAGIPYTIVRSTQFFEFIGAIAEAGGYADALRMSPALVQPISADDVATELARVAEALPANGTIEIAGPERLPLDELVARYLRTQGDARTVIADPDAKYFGLVLNDRSLTPGVSPHIGPTRFEDWMLQTRSRFRPFA